MSNKFTALIIYTGLDINGEEETRVSTVGDIAKLDDFVKFWFSLEQSDRNHEFAILTHPETHFDKLHSSLNQKLNDNTVLSENSMLTLSSDFSQDYVGQLILRLQTLNHPCNTIINYDERIDSLEIYSW